MKQPWNFAAARHRLQCEPNEAGGVHAGFTRRVRKHSAMRFGPSECLGSTPHQERALCALHARAVPALVRRIRITKSREANPWTSAVRSATCNLRVAGGSIDRYRRWSGLSTIGDEDIDPEDSGCARCSALREGLTDSAWRTETQRSPALGYCSAARTRTAIGRWPRLQAEKQKAALQAEIVPFFSPKMISASFRCKFLSCAGREWRKWLSDIVVTIISSGVEPEGTRGYFLLRRDTTSQACWVWLKVVMRRFRTTTFIIGL